MNTVDARPTAGIIKYSRTVGMTTMEGRGFYCPTDTAIGGNGRLYVVNRLRREQSPGRAGYRLRL